MRTVSIRLDDSVYEELSAMLELMGQTKQTFFETYTRTALRERSIPFIIRAPMEEKTSDKNSRMAAFDRLEAARKNDSEDIDYTRERDEALNAKYGAID